MQSVTDSVKGCIGDLCRKSKPNPNPSSAFHASFAPVRSTMQFSPKPMTPHKAAEQKRKENAAQKELEEEQKKLKEEQKELKEDQRKLLEQKRVFDENQKELEHEIDEMSLLYKSDKAKLTEFSLPICGKCRGLHMPSSCHLFTDQRKTMKIQQESYENRQAELDAQQRSLNERQRLFNERRDSMKVWLPDPWSPRLYPDKQHAEGGAKIKRRHSKTKRSKSKSKSKKGKKSHRRHH
jgi:hypothetical protein